MTYKVTTQNHTLAIRLEQEDTERKVVKPLLNETLPQQSAAINTILPKSMLSHLLHNLKKTVSDRGTEI